MTALHSIKYIKAVLQVQILLCMLTNMSLITECSYNFLNAKHELYYTIQCQRKKLPPEDNRILR